MKYGTELPDGFRYQPSFLSEAEERELLDGLAGIEWSEVRMHGVVAKRRVAHYGVNYEYGSWRVSPGPPIPAFLLSLRTRLAEWCGVAAEDLAEALATEYSSGTPIGWHRDAPQFGVVAAVSLAGSCKMRFRRQKGDQSDKREIVLAPRSAYLIAGESRTDWQHHIPPTAELRYSITFRTLRPRGGRSRAPKA